MRTQRASCQPGFRSPKCVLPPHFGKPRHCVPADLGNPRHLVPADVGKLRHFVPADFGMPKSQSLWDFGNPRHFGRPWNTQGVPLLPGFANPKCTLPPTQAEKSRCVLPHLRECKVASRLPTLSLRHSVQPREILGTQTAAVWCFHGCPRPAPDDECPPRHALSRCPKSSFPPHPP